MTTLTGPEVVNSVNFSLEMGEAKRIVIVFKNRRELLFWFQQPYSK